MRLGNLAIAGIVSLGVAGLMAYTHFDQAAKLRAGKWAQVAASVVSVVEARGAQHGGIAVLRWAGDGGQQDGGALVPTADFAAGKYKPGDSVQAWVHPGFSRPVLSAAEPNLQPDQSFTGYAAVACGILGLALLALAARSGAILVD